MAIHEMMVVTPELRAAIHENVDEQALERLVRNARQGLNQKWPPKVISGDTLRDEVMRSPAAAGEKRSMNYRYRAMTQDGQKLQGIIDANDERQARLRLREEGLFLLDIRPKVPGVKTRGPSGSAIVNWTLFTRQLATLSAQRHYPWKRALP